MSSLYSENQEQAKIVHQCYQASQKKLKFGNYIKKKSRSRTTNTTVTRANKTSWKLIGDNTLAGPRETRISYRWCRAGARNMLAYCKKKKKQKTSEQNTYFTKHKKTKTITYYNLKCYKLSRNEKYDYC